MVRAWSEKPPDCLSPAVHAGKRDDPYGIRTRVWLFCKVLELNEKKREGQRSCGLRTSEDQQSPATSGNGWQRVCVRIWSEIQEE